jgi:SAM-dependent methyltransferase
MRDAYLDEDVAAAARRFESSGEFEEVLRLIGRKLAGATVVDLGAGTGVASYAFAKAGAGEVVALEPDESEVVGQGAIRRACEGLPAVRIVTGLGEDLPLGSGTVDLVYARQVLHHARDLDRVVSECARVLRPGGVFLACREHVVGDEKELAEFLRAHPIHQLAGGENAWKLDQYLNAIRASGLELKKTLRPWDSLVNAFPEVRSNAELRGYWRVRLVAERGLFGRVAALVPGVEARMWRNLNRAPVPGRLFSFLCVKRGQE